MSEAELEVERDSVGVDEAVLLIVALRLGESVDEPVSVTLWLRLCVRLVLSEALDEVVVVALADQLSDADAVTLCDRVVLSVIEVDAEVLAVSVCEPDSEGDTLGVPLQMHSPLAGEPHEMKQHRLRHGEMVGETEPEAAVEALGEASAEAETVGGTLALGELLGVMQVQA